MTEFSFSHTDLADSRAAGEYLGRDLMEKLGGVEPPDMVLLFSSSRFSPADLLAAINETTRSPNVVGCTCAGEFVHGAIGTGSISALAIRSTGNAVFGRARAGFR